MRRANVNFRDDHHDRDIKSEGYAEVLSVSELALQDMRVPIRSLEDETSMAVLGETYLLMPTKPLFAATISKQ